MSPDNSIQPPNPLDAWSQSIDKPPHQVGGRARTMIEKSRQNPNPVTRRVHGSSPLGDPHQAVSEAQFDDDEE